MNIKVNFTRNILPQTEDQKSGPKKFLKKTKRVIKFSTRNELIRNDKDNLTIQNGRKDLDSEKIANVEQEKLIQSIIKSDFANVSFRKTNILYFF